MMMGRQSRKQSRSKKIGIPYPKLTWEVSSKGNMEVESFGISSSISSSWKRHEQFCVIGPMPGRAMEEVQPTSLK